MKAATGVAPGKLILLGEHAVVYGHPAIAVPLKQLCAEAEVSVTSADEPVAVALEDFEQHEGKMISKPGAGVWGTQFQIPQGINMVSPDFLASPEAAPFIKLLELATAGGRVPGKGWRMQVRSRIPIGCGLGSSAAVCAACFRAIHSAFDIECTPEKLAEQVYETERLLHGTPSGIDNTVVALGRPVLFRKGVTLHPMQAPPSNAFLVVGYSGVRHSTREIVGDVRKAWEADKATYDAIFEEVGELTREGVEAFQAADWKALGALMDRNQRSLELMGVSSAELERLIGAAREAGALGAKLSGAGRGGCMVALAGDAEQAERLRTAMEQAGAALSIRTGISG